MRWTVLGLGALVGAVALTACSSSDVKEDYRREANAICADAEKQLAKVPRPSFPSEVAKVVEREIAIREDAITKLSELHVPPEIGRAEAVIADLETRQERAHEVKKAAEDKDEEKLREVEEEGKRESEFEAQRARDAALPNCAEL